MRTCASSPSACPQLLRIPQHQRAAVESARDYALWVVLARLAPSNVVESARGQLARHRKAQLALYLDSTLTVATGLSSTPCSPSSSLSSQSSSCVSLEKSASTAPALVPVAINGCVGPGDQAKVAVLGISRRRTMVSGRRTNVLGQRIV